MASYQFAKGFKEFDEGSITPQDAGDELTRIQAEHGCLTPQAVVDESRPDDAPLHPAFEWNDAVAGERYRHIQASDLIKTVEVIKPSVDESKPEPVYVNVNRNAQRQQSVVEAVKSPEMFQSAFMQACERLIAAERAVERLQEIARRERPDAFRQCGKAVYVLRQLRTMLPGRRP